MELARASNGAIISADSRQIYRGFDIGTAKPGAEDRRGVLHYGVDIVDPDQHYSAFRWAQDAARWIGLALEAGKTPILVGGTGFYLKALFDPPFDIPPVPGFRLRPRYVVVDPGPSLRDRIEGRVDEMLARGWLDEVAALMHAVPEDAIAWKACGYRFMRGHLEGRYSLEHARERTVIATRQYAKRQRTWFRHQLP